MTGSEGGLSGKSGASLDACDGGGGRRGEAVTGTGRPIMDAVLR